MEPDREAGENRCETEDQVLGIVISRRFPLRHDGMVL